MHNSDQWIEIACTHHWKLLIVDIRHQAVLSYDENFTVGNVVCRDVMLHQRLCFCTVEPIVNLFR